MPVMNVPRRCLAVALAAFLTTAACVGGGLPPANQMAADVGRLDAVLPILEELRVTDFEASPFCRNLAYARGVYADLAQDGCARDGSIQFDEVAANDHARLVTAIDATTVATDRIRVATYAPDGDLETAWFALTEASITDNGDYLYDPTGVEPKVDVPDLQTFTRIDGDWWFVWSLDD